MRKIRFARLKRNVVRVLCSNSVGQLIGWCTGNQIQFRGTKITVSSPHVPDATKARLYFGIYESAECRFVNRYLRSDLTTIELGGSIGAVSSQISKRLTPGVRYVCIEANPYLIDILSENIKRNASHLNFEIVPGAIAYGQSKVDFGVGDDNRVSAVNPKKSDAAISVKAIQLKDLVPKNPYQLICDIEGAELGLLDHDAESLEQCVLAIVELHCVNDDKNRHTVANLAARFGEIGFQTLDQYGDVYVFSRSAKGPSIG